jgi:hypothetical protein
VLPALQLPVTSRTSGTAPLSRLPLCPKDGDDGAFERVLSAALPEHPTCLRAYCLIPNHWHFVVWPQREGERTTLVEPDTYAIKEILDIYHEH